MDRLNRQVQETRKLLSDPDTDWKDSSSAIEELATAVESLGHDVNHQDVVRLLLSLSVGIGMQLVSIRSKLVKDVCESLLRIVKALGQDFEDMANALLPQIVATAKSTSAAIRQPGSKLLSKLSEVVRYDLSRMRKIYLQLMQDKTRTLVLEQLRIVFVYWSDEEVLPYEADVLEIIRRGLEDQNEKVRKVAREVLTRVSSRWIERVDELVDFPSTQSKALLITEHRDSPLAEAILNRFPELADKLDSCSRSRSFMQSRASFRKSHRHKREQNIEIHVSATPPPKLPAEREVQIQQESSEHGSISRRLFDNPEFSTGPDQQDDMLEAFDEKHEYLPKPRNVQPLAPIPSPPAGIPSQAAVARSSNAYSVEEMSLLHPTARQLKVSKIPSPSNHSPSFFNKKRLESPARAISSPEQRPSLLPRSGSFTFKTCGSSGPSTPVGSAKFEEKKTEMNLLSASDEYFSKPIPSSVATSTSPSPPTDNVTLRPRRRTFARQEHEDLHTYQPELPHPELPKTEEVIQPRQVGITPEPYMRSSLLDQDVESPLREPDYGDDMFDSADDTGHLSDGKDHVEFDNEWSQRRLDDSTARSDGDNVFVEDDADQSKSSILTSGNDIFPDEWRLDDGPRHKFDHEDEIDRLSDDYDQSDFAVRLGDPTTVEEVKVADIAKRHEFAGSSPQENFTVQNDNEDEEVIDKNEITVEVNTSNDALTGLLNVRDEMNRLRAMTRNEDNSNPPFNQRHESLARCTTNTVSTAEELVELSMATHTVEHWGESTKKEPSYLERLTHADRYARSPLLADTPSKEKSAFFEQVSPSHSCESELLHTTASDDEHQQSEDNELLTIQSQSPSLLPIDQAIAKSKPDFVEESPFAETYSPRPTSNVSHKEIAQDQESFIVHEQAERFDAAEKLFAAKEVPLSHSCYDKLQQPKREHYLRPQSPTQGLYAQSRPFQQRYPPPTQMGAKVTSAFANAQRNVLGEDIDHDPKNTSDGDSNTDNGAKEDSPKASLGQTAENRSFQSVPCFVEAVVSTPTNSKHDTDPAPPTAIPERRPPLANSRPANLSWSCSLGITIIMFLAATFCIAGILHAAKTVHDAHEYHLNLQARIDKFEAGIVESHMKVLKLEEDYAIWSEYVRKLTEEDEANALTQLQAIQVEVQKWQQGMKEDLVQFRQALSVDSIEAAFANLRVNNTKQTEE